MDLKRVFTICQSLRPIIKYIQFGEIVYSNGLKQYQIIDWENYCKALNKLKKIKFLKSTVDGIYETLPEFSSYNISPRVDDFTKTAIINSVCVLMIKLDTICDLADMAGLSEE